MKEVICSADEKHFIILDAIVCQMFQQPHLKPAIAIVIRGEEGVGKSFFVEKLGALMHPFYFKTSNPAYVFGDHNSQLKDEFMLHLEEAMWAGSKREESSLKDMIASPTLQINEKFMPLYDVPNHLHFFITGNPEWLIAAGMKARRFFALHASEAHIREPKYFGALHAWFVNGGDAALLHHYLNHDFMAALKEIGIDDIRNIPVTDELIHQKQQNMGGVAGWLDNLIESHIMPYGTRVPEIDKAHDYNGAPGRIVKRYHVEVIKKALYFDYCKTQERLRAGNILNPKKFGSELLKLLPLVIDGVVQKYPNGKVMSVVNPNIKSEDNFKDRRDAYDIPSWSVVRQAFDFSFGKKSELDESKEWDVLNMMYPEEKEWRGY